MSESKPQLTPTTQVQQSIEVATSPTNIAIAIGRRYRRNAKTSKSGSLNLPEVTVLCTDDSGATTDETLFTLQADEAAGCLIVQTQAQHLEKLHKLIQKYDVPNGAKPRTDSRQPVKDPQEQPKSPVNGRTLAAIAGGVLLLAVTVACFFWFNDSTDKSPPATGVAAATEDTPENTPSTESVRPTPNTADTNPAPPVVADRSGQKPDPQPSSRMRSIPLRRKSVRIAGGGRQCVVALAYDFGRVNSELWVFDLATEKQVMHLKGIADTTLVATSLDRLCIVETSKGRAAPAASTFSLFQLPDCKPIIEGQRLEIEQTIGFDSLVTNEHGTGPFFLLSKYGKRFLRIDPQSGDLTELDWLTGITRLDFVTSDGKSIIGQNQGSVVSIPVTAPTTSTELHPRYTGLPICYVPGSDRLFTRVGLCRPNRRALQRLDWGSSSSVVVPLGDGSLYLRGSPKIPGGRWNLFDTRTSQKVANIGSLPVEPIVHRQGIKPGEDSTADFMHWSAATSKLATVKDGLLFITALRLDAMLQPGTVVITSQPPSAIGRNKTLDYQVKTLTNADVRFELAFAPDGAKIDKTGRVQWKAAPEHHGPFATFIIHASRGEAEPTLHSFCIELL